MLKVDRQVFSEKKEKENLQCCSIYKDLFFSSVFFSTLAPTRNVRTKNLTAKCELTVNFMFVAKILPSTTFCFENFLKIVFIKNFFIFVSTVNIHFNHHFSNFIHFKNISLLRQCKVDAS